MGLREPGRTWREPCPCRYSNPQATSSSAARPRDDGSSWTGGCSTWNQAFLPAWQRYRRALQQRNAALKTRNGSAAWTWDESLVADGMIVDECRRSFMALLEPVTTSIGDRLLGADIELDYQSGWAEGSALREALASSRDRDLQLGTSTVGPHRADIRIACGRDGPGTRYPAARRSWWRRR